MFLPLKNFCYTSVFVCKGHFWWRQTWRHLHVTLLQCWDKFSNVLVHWSIRMIRAKNYETVSKFVEVMTKIRWPLFFPDTVYSASHGKNVKGFKNVTKIKKRSWEGRIKMSVIFTVWSHAFSDFTFTKTSVCRLHLPLQESLANAKVSARQPCWSKTDFDVK